MKNIKDKWLKAWKGNVTHHKSKVENFETLVKYLEEPPKRMLEIGCGLAYESEMFYKKFGTEIWLLDGDWSPEKKPKQVNWHEEASEFSFYSKIEELKQSYDKREMEYRFVDANEIDIPEDITFDLICSFKSCGFHFPAKTYKDLVKKHSHNNTKVIFDIRTNEEGVMQDKSFNIVKKVKEVRKCCLTEINFE